jgi:hypothetical protein
MLSIIAFIAAFFSLQCSEQARKNRKLLEGLTLLFAGSFFFWGGMKLL